MNNDILSNGTVHVDSAQVLKTYGLPRPDVSVEIERDRGQLVTVTHGVDLDETDRAAVRAVAKSLPGAGYDIEQRLDMSKGPLGTLHVSIGLTIDDETRSEAWPLVAKLPRKPIRIEVGPYGATGYMGHDEAQERVARMRRQIKQHGDRLMWSDLPSDVRAAAFGHAVELNAYYGKPVAELSVRQIATWFMLRGELGLDT